MDWSIAASWAGFPSASIPGGMPAFDALPLLPLNGLLLFAPAAGAGFAAPPPPNPLLPPVLPTGSFIICKNSA